MSDPNAIYSNKPDGASIVVFPDGRWDIALQGKHTRGHAENQEAGVAAAEKIYERWVLERWRAGHPAAGGRYICPLKD